VLDGIQKRLTRILDPTALRRRLVELLRAETPPEAQVSVLETRLAETRRKIGRLVEALASGPEDLPSGRAALASLETERARLEGELTRARAKAAPDGTRGLEEVVDKLREVLHRVRDMLAAGTAEQRKAVVRSFLAGIRVDKATRQAVFRWYRLPRDLSLTVSWWSWGVTSLTVSASRRWHCPVPPGREANEDCRKLDHIAPLRLTAALS
jgi:hypothetical protein